MKSVRICDHYIPFFPITSDCVLVQKQCCTVCMIYCCKCVPTRGVSICPCIFCLGLCKNTVSVKKLVNIIGRVVD